MVFNKGISKGFNFGLLGCRLARCADLSVQGPGTPANLMSVLAVLSEEIFYLICITRLVQCTKRIHLHDGEIIAKEEPGGNIDDVLRATIKVRRQF